jgi:hypothetical protein
MEACRHTLGTSVYRPPATRPPCARRPRWTVRQRPQSKTAFARRGARQAVVPGRVTPAAVLGQTAASLAVPWLTSLVEVLPRPIESTQYLSTRYTERLAAVGIEASVENRGDACENALAGSVIGLFKAEVIRHAGSWLELPRFSGAVMVGFSCCN